METAENYELTKEMEELKHFLLSTNTEAFEMIEDYVLGATKSQLKEINLDLLEKRKQARKRLEEIEGEMPCKKWEKVRKQ